MNLTVKPRTLQQALRLLLLGVLVPLLLATLVLLAVQAWHENRLGAARMSAMAGVVVKAVDAELMRSRAQLEVIAVSPAIDEGDWHKLYRFAQDVATQRPGGAIALIGPDGQQLVNTAVAWGTPLPNVWAIGTEGRMATWQGRQLPLSSGDLSRQAFERGEPTYSNVFYAFHLQAPYLAVAIPVVRDGLPRYSLVYAYPPDVLQGLLRTAVDEPDVRALLADRDGRIVAVNESSRSRVGDRVRVSIGLDSPRHEGTCRIEARDGTLMVGAFAVSRVNGFVVRLAQPAKGALLPHTPSSWAWVGLIVAAMAASVVMAGLASRWLAMPLRRLGEDLRAGREPSLDPGETVVEVALLAQALRDGMGAERLRASAEAARLVAESREAVLRQGDRQKDEFLATLAHELRNPLAPIRTAAEVIRLSGPANPRVERARTTIERQALHLTRLVDDLLDVSRITQGRIRVRREPVDLRDVAAAALETVEPAARERGLSLQAEVDPAPMVVLGDGTRLTQCLVNLLANATKFTSAGGRIDVRVGHESGRATMEVADTGAGISQAQFGRIFELFAQERISGMDGNSGLGIGLFLVRRIVTLHGGEVEASSPGLGRGSTFRITLPLAPAGGEAGTPDEARHEAQELG